jgi:hypothetical protein
VGRIYDKAKKQLHNFLTQRIRDRKLNADKISLRQSLRFPSTAPKKTLRRISFFLTAVELLSLVMRTLFLVLFIVCRSLSLNAAKVTGTVTNQNGEPLPYSSITVKGSKEAASANSEGVYFLQLPAGTYTIICRHVGFERQEKTISIKEDEVQLNFVLKEQSVSLSCESWCRRSCICHHPQSN